MDNPAFRKFDYPRVDTSGEPLRVYAYQKPAALSDGWAVSTVEAEGLDPGQLRGFMNRILNGKWGRAEGVVIARNGRLVVDEYFHGFHRDKLHTLQSVTKSITSLLFGVAKDQGSIKSVDQVVYEFFPEYVGRTWVDQKYDRTLYHLLTMTAAIDWDEHVPYGQIENSNTAMNRSPDWIGYVLDRNVAGPPGKVCVYTSGFTILLGGVIKKATGKYVDELADETLFGTLGITNYRWLRHDDGTRHTGGGLSLLPRDLAKVGQLVLNGGTWNGERVISEAWIKESTRPHVPMEAYRLKQFRYTERYAYQWWNDTYQVDGRAIDVIAGHGFGGQYLGIVPDLNLVIVLIGGDYVDQTIRPFEYYKIMEQEILPAFRSSP